MEIDHGLGGGNGVPRLQGDGMLESGTPISLAVTGALPGAPAFVVVGSGATAVCCAPELARVSRTLVMLQRSPSWIYEASNEAGPLIRLCQALHGRGLPCAVAWLRTWLQLRDDLVFVGLVEQTLLADDAHDFTELIEDCAPLASKDWKNLLPLLQKYPKV